MHSLYVIISNLPASHNGTPRRIGETNQPALGTQFYTFLRPSKVKVFFEIWSSHITLKAILFVKYTFTAVETLK